MLTCRSSVRFSVSRLATAAKHKGLCSLEVNGPTPREEYRKGMAIVYRCVLYFRAVRETLSTSPKVILFGIGLLMRTACGR
eukprot:m.123535 g.123535  ORF g.123535 m.123535 type:complete len:81 (-) comp15680_c0_seq5:1443-1685(-)